MALRSLSDVTLSTPGSEVLVEKDFVQGDIPYETVVPGNFTASGTPRTVSDAVVGTAVSSEAILQPAVVENKESSFQLYERAFQHYLGTSTEEAKVGTPFTPSAPTTTWEDIWAHVLKAEGGYANNPLDPGGETNYGISRAAYPNLNIRSLTPDDAKSIFKVDYFDKVNGDLLLLVNPGVAAHVADMAFNAGPQTAINLLYDSVGLPRQDRITNELVDRISSSEEAIANYTKARLSYYASLYTAPTFMKGWVNRVSNLNKALGTKSGLGGAYAAARDLDVEYLVQNQYGSYRNAQPRFRDLDESERGYLRERELLLSPGYQAAKSAIPADIRDVAPSSISEIFGATQSKRANVDSSTGLDDIVLKEVEEAYRLNVTAAGKDYQPMNPFEAGDSAMKTRLRLWELKKLMTDNPNVDFPIKSFDHIYASAVEKAQEIQKRYDILENAPMNSLGGVAHRIGQVLFGYLPGEIVGMAQDPKELALMAATSGQARTVGQIGKVAAQTFLGELTIQGEVQKKRQLLGLEGSFQQGALNALGAGASVAAIAGLSVGLQKLWKLGSKDAAKVANQLADQVDNVVDTSVKTTDSLYIKKEVEGLRDVANLYKNNPLGGDFKSKLMLETRMAQASEDIISGRPVRNFNDNIRKYVPTDKQYVKDYAQALRDSGPEGDVLAKEYLAKVKSWDKLKKDMVYHNVYQSLDDIDTSVVPVLNPKTNDLYSFTNLNEAKKFLKGKEAEGLISDHAIDIAQFPDKPGYFLVRSADLEPSSALSGRMLGDDTVEDSVGGVLARGFKESDDLATATKYPNYSRIREFKPVEQVDELVSYPRNYAVDDSKDFVRQLDDYIKSDKAIPQKEATTRLISRLEEMEKAHIEAGNKGPAMMDISDTLGVEERVSVREFIDDIQKDQAGLAGMLDCMV
jgi:hypothetical protein